MKPERKSSGGKTKEDCFDLSSMKIAINHVGKQPPVKRFFRGKPLSDKLIRMLEERRVLAENFDKTLRDLKAKGIYVPYY